MNEPMFAPATLTWPGRTGKVLFVQHQNDAGPGYIGERMEQRGASVHVVFAQDPQLPDPRDFDLVVSLGSYDAAYDESLSHIRRELGLLSDAVAHDVPVFGICFGAQLLSRVLGGTVERSKSGPEIGWIEVNIDPGSQVPVVGPGPWLVWHLDVMTIPPGGVEHARTAVGIQAYTHGPHLGVQFHPEATLDSIRQWTAHCDALLRELDIDPAYFLMQSASRDDETRRLAYELADVVVDRATAFVGLSAAMPSPR